MAKSRVIGIDASRLSVDQLTGTETYTRRLLEGFAHLATNDEFVLYANASEPPLNVRAPGEWVCIPSPRLWTHARLSAEMLRRRPAALFVPAHVIPLIHPRSVVTVHDLGYLHHPESHTEGQVRMLDLTTRWSVRAARRVIAISQCTKDDLIERYAVPESKIVVIHHGVAPEFAPVARARVDFVRQKYDLPETYVLCVGTLQPRKNIARLVEAIEIARHSGLDVTLVHAGKRGWMADDVIADIQSAGTAIKMLGYVDDLDLPALYGGAVVYCQPSLYEGFGMPVIEAMACGTPNVISTTGALPEIAGDAAILVDPLDTPGMAGAIQRLSLDQSLHARYRAAGLSRARTFTWELTARATLDVLREVRDA